MYNSINSLFSYLYKQFWMFFSWTAEYIWNWCGHGTLLVRANNTNKVETVSVQTDAIIGKKKSEWHPIVTSLSLKKPGSHLIFKLSFVYSRPHLTIFILLLWKHAYISNKYSLVFSTNKFCKSKFSSNYLAIKASMLPYKIHITIFGRSAVQGFSNLCLQWLNLRHYIAVYTVKMKVWYQGSINNRWWLVTINR